MTMHRRAAKIALAVKIAVFAGVVLLALRFALTYASVRVPEGNDQMAPTLRPGAKVFLHRGFRRARDFRHGYIVAYAARGGEEGAAELRFGRVVGLPGDRVALKPGPGGASDAEVRVNGEIISYSPEIETGPTEPTGEVTRGRTPGRGPPGSRTGRAPQSGDGGAAHSPGSSVAGPPEPMIVPDGALYLVNDRRGSRLADSRTAGPVDERSFVGKVVLTLSW